MKWIKFSDRKPMRDDCPSGRVLLAFHLEDGVITYSDWGIRSKALDYPDLVCDVSWMPIPLLPDQEPYWWEKEEKL